MPIEYTLRENRLTSEPGDYMAMVTSTRTADYEEVIDRVVRQGTTRAAHLMWWVKSLTLSVNCQLSIVNCGFPCY